MLIKDLKDKYPLVYEAALQNQKNQGNVMDDSKNLINNADRGNFNWEKTPENYDFWVYLNREQYKEAKTICPHLFESNKVNNLLDCHGKHFKAKIQDTECEGVIAVEEGRVYLCQNIKNGYRCSNTQGYKYGWDVMSGSDNNLRINWVTNFQLIDKPTEPKIKIDKIDKIIGNSIYGGMDSVAKSDTVLTVHKPEPTHPLLSKPTNKRQLLTIK